jgi:RHS repeat-associated protein
VTELQTRTKYTYDSVGNRLTDLGSATWSYNSSNELNSRPSYSYTYDANGNTQTMINSSGTTTYGWDFENRLTSVALPGSGGTVNFKYDPFGRRIYKSSSTSTSVYAYDQNNLIEETSSSGVATARYQFGLNLDEQLVVLQGTSTSFFEAAGLGSISSLTSSSGAIAETYTYDSFGNLTGSNGSLSNRIRYTGREFDTETGLYFNRARYFDATTGKFLSEDPLKFLSADVNFYRYVWNRPANLKDPRGLWAGGDDAVAAGVGGVLGVAGQGISDVFSGQLSSGASYIGAFAGGAAAGETLLYTFNPALAGTVGGAAGNLAKQGINNLTGAQHGFDSGDFLIDTSSGFVTGLIPDGGTALKGIAGKLEKGLPGAMGAGLLDAAKRIICN